MTSEPLYGTDAIKGFVGGLFGLLTTASAGGPLRMARASMDDQKKRRVG